jgi:hypothetical protein
LILQQLPAILSTVFDDDRVQRCGTDFIGIAIQESDVPGFLANKAKF